MAGIGKRTTVVATLIVLGSGLPLSACGTDSDSGCAELANIPWEGCPPKDSKRSGAAPTDHAVTVLWTLNTDEQGLDALLDQQQADRLAGRRATYLPAQELRERFGAKSQDATTVVAYLRDQEVDASLDATGSFVTSTMTPAQVKATLKTTLSEYSVDHLGATFNVVSADSAPILPKQLSGIVTEVPPATRTG